MTISYSAPRGIDPENFIYVRNASTLAIPIVAGAQNYTLISWVKDPSQGNALIEAIGTDQHDNSIYTWVIDGTTMPFSGSARVGSIQQPYEFLDPIICQQSVLLYITNNNSIAYPNNGVDPADAIPYEGLFTGRWA
jgi:hypothetical protein